MEEIKFVLVEIVAISLPLAGGGAFAEYAKAEHWNECDLL